MSYRIGRLLTAGLITLMLIMAVLPSNALAGGSMGARQMLIFYYDLINARDYANAYARWVNPPQTYAQFVAGYADTATITTYFGGFQSFGTGRIEGRVAGILVGTHWNGTQTAYSGCYDVRYNDDATGIGQWSILGGNFTPMAYVPISGARDDGGISALLGSINCLPRYNPDGSYVAVQYMLSDYVDAVNRGDWARAYAFWDVQSPIRQTYEQFVNGWTTTVETVLFYGNYQFSGTTRAAEVGRIPVVMMGYHTDGSLAAYQGCIGVYFDPGTMPSQWRIWNAYLAPMVLVTTPTDAQIAGALNAACY